MILVLLGTQHNEFKRLLEKVENSIENGIINEKTVVQAGFTNYKSDRMEIFDMIPKDKLNELVDESEIVITHGGVGSITMALKKDKKVIAVPRLHEYNEHVNNHQVQIVNIFDKNGYLIGIQDVNELPKAIEKAKNFKPKKYKNNNQKMINIIENFIDNIK